MNDILILDKIQAAFVNTLRPEHFTNYLHCEECKDHDDTLKSKQLNELTINELAYPGYDPITFCTAEAKSYLFSTLAKITLETSTSDCAYWYGVQLINQLDYSGSDFLQLCNKLQREAVSDFLSYLIETRTNLIEQYDLIDDFLHAYEIWHDSN